MLQKRWLVLFGRMIAAILCAVIYFSHPLMSDIPLGYDAGLYKSMIEAYGSLGTHRDWSLLPDWIQRKYPPMVGMIAAVVGLVSGVSSQDIGGRLVLRGVAWLVVLLLSSLYVYTLALNKNNKTGMLVVLFGVGSFVLYNLYWWGYIKQLLAGILLLISLSLLMKKKYILSVLVVVAALLTQRPAIVLLGFIFVFTWLFEPEKKERIKILISGGVSVCLWYSLYQGFFDVQIVSMIKPFLSAVDLPVAYDSFQEGGTFLTISDYISKSWPIIVGGVLGTIALLSQQTKQVRVHISLVVLLLAWVFLQGFFFQRMIGYLELFLLVSMACGLEKAMSLIKDKKSRHFVVICCICLVGIQYGLTMHGKNAIDLPLIEPQEFAFIQQIDTLVEEDSIIIVPSENYGPWIMGRTNADIIAPGGYSLGVRRKRGSYQWQNNWRNASSQQKCDAVEAEYGGPERTLYVRLGSKQTKFTDMTGACFSLIKAGNEPFHALYRLDFEENDN